jgi:hypothetical protein
MMGAEPGRPNELSPITRIDTARVRPVQSAAGWKFHDVPHPGQTRNKKGILAAFAAEHRHFLMAPDLSTVMSPGTRRARC